MPIKLTVLNTYGGANETSSLDVTDDAEIDRVAKLLGYQTQVPDPDWQSRIDAAQAAFYSADPNSAERAAAADEVRALQQQQGQLVANPESAARFLITKYLGGIQADLIDRQAAEAIGRKAANAAVESQQAALASKVVVTEPGE